MEGASKELTDRNKATVIHEFVHRSFYENPELIKFYNENKLGFDERAHGMISYMIGKEFPNLKEKEYKRAKAVYDIDLNDKETEDEFKNLYNEATKISKNILDEKRKKENIKQEKEEKPSLFETIKKTLGFNKGGVVNINYLTREL